mgnify:CR=1 FL=1
MIILESMVNFSDTYNLVYVSMRESGCLMNIIRITQEELSKKQFNNEVFYNREVFCEYNKNKVEEVYYLLFADGKKERFVIPFGRRNSTLYAPFSAPYCLPGEISANTSAKHYGEAIEQMIGYARTLRVTAINITFPPFFYANRQISHWINACVNLGGNIGKWDLNYAIDLYQIKEVGYQKCLNYNARRNLRISHERGCEVKECLEKKEVEECYEIIRKNRESKGYPLRMTFEQVEWTRNLSEGKWFCVLCEGEKIASAVIFPVTTEIAQVIYWGNVPGSEEKKPINALAEFLTDFYLKLGFKFLDIGPSTDQGIPNYGLIDFKESIGCQTDSKVTIDLKIK